MGGGDLNLKKSFHPLTFRNQEKVWKEEHKAEEEQKKLEQLRKELEEERELQRLHKLQEDQGQRKKSDRLDWMYAAGPGGAPALKSADQESYLLGTRRVDQLLKAGAQREEEEEKAKRDLATMGNRGANSARDLQAKIREDPLFAIKQREQATVKAIASNPIRMRERREGKEKERERSKKDSSHKRHRSERSSHHSRSSDRHRDRGSHRSSYRPREDGEGGSYSGSRHSNGHPLEDGDDESRSRSGLSHHSSRHRSQSPRRDRERESRRSSSPRREHRRHQPMDRTDPPQLKDDAEEKQRRLQAMMDNAKRVQDGRERRLRDVNEADRVAQELDEVARRRARLGEGDVGFIRQAHRAAYADVAGSSSLADRVKRTRANLINED